MRINPLTAALFWPRSANAQSVVGTISGEKEIKVFPLQDGGIVVGVNETRVLINMGDDTVYPGFSFTPKKISGEDRYYLTHPMEVERSCVSEYKRDSGMSARCYIIADGSGMVNKVEQKAIESVQELVNTLTDPAEKARAQTLLFMLQTLAAAPIL